MIGVMLLAQLMVSAYACPGQSAASAATAMKMSMSAEPGVPQLVNCEDMAGPMDPEFANLCAEHCRYGQQSDQTATLSVPPALLSAFYITPLAPEPRIAPRPAAAEASARAAVFPPLAIQHCCFRI